MRALSDKQIEAVLALPAPKRYEHFVKQVADSELAWGLYADGWALSATDDTNESVFPFWPAPEYAQRCAEREWAEYKPKEISLNELVDDLLPRLEEDRVLAGVFWTPSSNGVVVSPTELREALRAEASQYE